MPGAFERLAKSVLLHLGKDALLLSGGTSTPCKANIEHAVQVAGAFDDAVFERTVATFDKTEVRPRAGDRLEHPDGNFTLDGLLSDSGYAVRFTLQPA